MREESDSKIWYDASLSEPRTNPPEVPSKYHIPLFFLNIVMAIGDSAKILIADERQSVAFKNRASEYIDALFRSNDRMEALAGTLLIAKYSIMRPNVPGVWYTMGSALRLAVDLGLHAEKLNKNYDPFTRDFRRRLFWCTFSLDRQICAFFGRPFGIPDENISTEFPSSLDDALITTSADNIEDYSLVKSSMASYKCISLAFFKIRKIQAQIVQELYAHRASLPNGYEDVDEWREIMNEELDEWYERKVPKTHRKMNCPFPQELFKLELFHSKVMLYGLCPKSMTLNERGYEMVYDNTKGIIEIYYKLCIDENITHTWVAVHNLFMSGMTFLYVLHNARRDLGDSLQTIQKTCSTLIYVLERLTSKCEAAKKGSQIFKVLCAAVLKLRAEKCGELNEPGQAENEESNERDNETAPVLDEEAPGLDEEAAGLDEEARMSRFEAPSKDSLVPDLDSGALNQFFVELDKLSPFSDMSNGQVDFSKQLTRKESRHKDRLPHVNAVGLSPKPVTDGEVETASMSSLETYPNPSARPDLSSKDGQRVFDMMNQFSTETIWDQVFSK